MFKSKTTWAGIGSILAAIGHALATKDLSAAIIGVTSGLGLIVAADQSEEQ